MSEILVLSKRRFLILSLIDSRIARSLLHEFIQDFGHYYNFCLKLN
jgi:hypothetical protein